MSAKHLFAVSATVLVAAIFGAPNAALAQLGPPPGPPPMLAGPPPGLGAGAPPPGFTAGLPPGGPGSALPGLSPNKPLGATPRDFAGGPPRMARLDAELRGLDRRRPDNLRGIEGRAAAYGRSDYGRNRYAD
jgi:hypothetical protein